MTNYIYTSTDEGRDGTFILKKVILVRRSTVDLRSCSLSGLLAGKLFCRKKEYGVSSSTRLHIHLLSGVRLCLKHSNTIFYCEIQHFVTVWVCFLCGAVTVINTSTRFVFTGSHVECGGQRALKESHVDRKMAGGSTFHRADCCHLVQLSLRYM